MFEKIGSLINLFRKGNEVANVELWKTGGISVAALAAALLALVSTGGAFGLHLQITADQANGIATGIIAIVGVVLPLITSKRAGILPAKESNLAPIEDHSLSVAVPAVAETNTSTDVRTEPIPPIYDINNPLSGLDTTYAG